ncbi:MAG: group III truncated hemoglobin [Chitinophagales bacterium]
MEDIKNRADIKTMVDSFYNEVRKNERLHFLFDETAKVNWPEHLPRMYDFWESILFDKALFSGNPMQKHQKLHSMQALKPEDFEIWLSIFNKNLDTLFEGPIVEKARQRAESIATITKIKTIYNKPF